jgi:carbon-monoxide dehydrogenase iron sulfur subunit
MYCMISCTFKHYGETGFEKSFIRIMDDPRSPKKRFVGIYCAHCQEPLCLHACPANAIWKDEGTGIVKINTSMCIGCRACIAACPTSNPRFDAEKRTVVKCDFCDGDPQCVKFCAAEALRRTTRKVARGEIL